MRFHHAFAALVTLSAVAACQVKVVGPAATPVPSPSPSAAVKATLEPTMSPEATATKTPAASPTPDDGNLHATWQQGFGPERVGAPRAVNITVTPDGQASYDIPAGTNGAGTAGQPVALDAALTTRLFADVVQPTPTPPPSPDLCLDGPAHLWHVTYHTSMANNGTCGAQDMAIALVTDLEDVYKALGLDSLTFATPTP